jgi:hypothetical protein
MLTHHVLERMVDRVFTETDLRWMLHRARGLRSSGGALGWIVETRHRSRAWEVVLELEPEARLLIVVTAYPVGNR